MARYGGERVVHRPEILRAQVGYDDVDDDLLSHIDSLIDSHGFAARDDWGRPIRTVTAERYL